MTAADIIAAHRGQHATNKTDLWTACRCGDGVRYYNPAEHARHVLAALKAAGYEVVQLPAPTRHTDNTAQWDGLYWSVIRNVGVVISDVAHLQSFAPDEARSLAAALLAAANAAEEAK